MTKTERILGYLPGTFRPELRLSALRAIAGAFGIELQQAENNLAAVMQSHWVDHADRGAEVIDDLACIASLYGLSPQADETVEEFREHLKRYVRTFLEGTLTVQGILRVTAEALGLHIADDYEEMDAWWTRDEDELVTIEPLGNDATELIFGFEAANAIGQPDRPAQAMGDVDLKGGVDLREAATLYVKVDDELPIKIDLLDSVADPAAVTLDEIVAAINNKSNAVADHDGVRLNIASPTAGPSSFLEIMEVENDAAERVLGLAPRTYHGREARSAEVIGMADLSSVVDLSDVRYIRLAIDGTHVEEIDCAGLNPANTTLGQIVNAINGAFNPGVVEAAINEGRYLRLTSKSAGAKSSIAILQPAAQDATTRLFGALSTSYYMGQDELPARVTGRRDLSQGADLKERSNIRLKIDGTSRTIDCAGVDPANTRPAEIVAAINSAFEPELVAQHNGRVITLNSPNVGPDGEIVLETPPNGDATEEIFGVRPRSFTGVAATSARISGASDLSLGLNLWSRHVLKIAVDGGPSTEIDLRAEVADPGAVGLDEMAAAIDTALGVDVCTPDGQHLILVSPTTGGPSSLAIEPLKINRHRRFVTRAKITDEAARPIFGFIDREAQGTPATSARLKGEVDLSRGVDLRNMRYLRVAVDGWPAVDIDCAGKRPRATLLYEIVDAINDALKPKLEPSAVVAARDDHFLFLTSPSSGAKSRIAIESPRSADALETLLGVEPRTYRGEDATGVNFVGTVDLSGGVELEANAAIKLGVDGADLVEIKLGETETGHKTLNQLVIAINLALSANVATHDGTHIVLISPSVGPDSQIEFEVTEGPDATESIFGIVSPRTYRGAEAVPAEVVGTQDLSGGADLQTARHLRLAVDGEEVSDVDCAVQAADPAAATSDEIVMAINEALGEVVAFPEGTYLKLRSIKKGKAGRITLEAHTSGDASKALFGDDVTEVVEGSDPAPAVITGETDLLAPVDLSQRRLIRLAVDGGRPVDINVSGATPETTFLDEIVAAINQHFPDLATATEDDRLQIRSPTVGEESRLSLLPLRYLEVVEYPPESMAEEDAPSWTVKHGDVWSIVNDGAANTFVEVEITAPNGVFGPALVNESLGMQVRLLTVLTPGETARLWRDPERDIQAEICSPDGDHPSRVLSESEILVGSLNGGTVPQKKEAVLTLPCGRSEWIYEDCYGSRFNQARFDAASFAGVRCVDRGVFNASRFTSEDETEPVTAVFASREPLQDPPVEVVFRWDCYKAGAFCVNLPADLPARFGGRFNEARFGQRRETPELYEKAVTEPPDDERFLITLINEGRSDEDPLISPSKLVVANPEIVKSVPLGWAAVEIPFRKPQFLTLGNENRSARIYLTEEGLNGFIELEAKGSGSWGNEIAVSARKSGPAMYDVSIIYEGARFENARQVALGMGPPSLPSPCQKGKARPPVDQTVPSEGLPPLIRNLLQPGPIGVLQAKAAGVKADVSRDGTGQVVERQNKILRSE